MSKSSKLKRKKRILIVYPHLSSFVKQDIHLLENDYNILQSHFQLKKELFSFITSQLKGIFNLLIQIPKSDVIYIWFADYHAFWSVLLSKIFRKKSIIVVGGYDAVVINDINYGLFLKNNIRAKLSKWTLKNCDKIISVDKALIDGKNDYCPYKNTTGLVRLVGKEVLEKSEIIPTGYDHSFWKINEKKKQVLTVASINNYRTYLIKGLDLFFGVAKRLPDTEFIVIGVSNTDVIPKKYTSLKNVIIHEPKPHAELVKYYSEAKVYAQFSITEGLPNVLCEAMMSGCIPVGSNVNGIPRAIGDTGYILEEKDVEKATELTKKALNDSHKKALEARNRIINHFSLELRQQKLAELIKEISF